LVGVAGVPFANRFFAYGKSGFYRAETEVSSALLAASDKNTGRHSARACASISRGTSEYEPNGSATAMSEAAT
jgi:hypothetical protein